MSDDKKVQDEDLKKLEDEAYFELLQIIAEAMETQDIGLLDSRIATWKSKYKKLLDRPSTSSRSDFKKRVEFLLTQYYSSVTQYILNKLKLNEEEKVQNQSKALRELYRIIKDTNDLKLLREKVKKWKEKYPVDGFLKMYQKRIEFLARDKNLRENAFDQEKAFADLVDITKKNLKFDELNIEIGYWEKEYSINDKYTIDDFLKHQSEVKRYTSPEFLQSIARDEPTIYIPNENIAAFSNLSTQKNAYDNLMARINGHNSIDKVFEWVYKNRYIKFDDTYKEMILSATYLDYNPQYLMQLSEPKMDMSKSSLSFEEYNNIDEIKRYAVLSYFNMLLPTNMAIPNDYFEKNILTVYAKSERARLSNDIKPDLSSDLGTSQSYEYKPISKEEISTPVQEQEVEIDNNSDFGNKGNAQTFEIETKIKEPEFDIPTIENKVVQIDDEPTSEKVVTAEEKPLDYETAIILSPLFFETVNSYKHQADLINVIDGTVTKYIEKKERQESLELGGIEKTKLE